MHSTFGSAGEPLTSLLTQISPDATQVAAVRKPDDEGVLRWHVSYIVPEPQTCESPPGAA